MYLLTETEKNFYLGGFSKRAVANKMWKIFCTIFNLQFNCRMPSNKFISQTSYDDYEKNCIALPYLMSSV